MGMSSYRLGSDGHFSQDSKVRHLDRPLVQTNFTVFKECEHAQNHVLSFYGKPGLAIQRTKINPKGSSFLLGPLPSRDDTISVTNRFLVLWSGSISDRFSNDHLSKQFPLGVDGPCLLDLIVDERIVVLQIRA
jgi:hypothetical protein